MNRPRVRFRYLCKYATKCNIYELGSFCLQAVGVWLRLAVAWTHPNESRLSRGIPTPHLGLALV